MKIRSFRIEPGEVEAVLNRQASVAASVVVARQDPSGHKRLVAYVVPADGADVDPGEMRGNLAGELPAYLVPAAIVTIVALPLNPNGKLDQRALPAPDFSGMITGREPGTPKEMMLCRLFAEVLGLERTGIDDRFFDLGGDSVLAVRLCRRAREAGWMLALSDVFALQCVGALAAVLQPVPVTVPTPSDTPLITLTHLKVAPLLP